MKTKLLEEVLKTVAEVTNVSGEDIVSPKRDREISEARQMFVWFCKVNGGCVNDILKFINRKDKNCITELTTNYNSNYAILTMYRIMADKIARILPPRLKQVAVEEEKKDMENLLKCQENSPANSSPK